ncbi:MAG: TIGR00153 family protein [Thermodesulfobacteriota bacterium]
MFFFKKEKEVNKLLHEYLDVVEKCVELGNESIQLYLAGEKNQAESLGSQAFDKETEADTIRYTIRDKLFSGAYLPLIREDIYNLIDNVDKVCNQSEECCNFFLYQQPEFPEEMLPHFKAIAKASFETYYPLKQSILSFLSGEGPLSEVREYSKSVGFKESEVDELERSLTRKIFSADLELSRKLHLRRTIHRIIAVSDVAENAADILDLIAVKTSGK